MPTLPPSSIAELLAPLPGDIRDLVEATRARVRAVVPHAVERLRPGWGLIGYNAPHYFAFIAPARDHVRLGFERGVRLVNGAHLLEGTGRQVRYVVLRRLSDVRRAAVSALLREAAGSMPGKKR